MHFRIMSLYLALLLSSALGSTDSVRDQTNAFLRDLASNSYNKDVFPEGSGGPGTPVRVFVSLYILDFNKMDDSEMDFTAHMYFRQTWNDSRLKYNMDVESLTFNSAENIWTPDLFFVEQREGQLHQIVIPNIMVRIKPHGEVLLSSRFGITFKCPMDLRNYPHDTQKCTINIASYAFTRKHVDLFWYDASNKPIGFMEKLSTLEFELMEATPSISHVEFSSGAYSRLELNLKFKRKFGLFATRLYVPFFILVFMTSLSFWIRADERCLRLALLLVILFLMVTLSTSMNRLAPPAPYTKASDVWIGFCESLVFAAFLEFVMVVLISRREAGDDNSNSKGEMLSFELEEKDYTFKSPLSRILNMFGARQGVFRNPLYLRIDKICRAVFPIIFILFNIIYWSVYCCSL